MSERTAAIKRETSETRIELRVTLDGEGECTGSTGIGFFDHMLQLIARHSGMNIRFEAQGDLGVDEHHMVEDFGIVLGRAIAQALGSKAGIQRYGWAALPMDEVLVLVALDLGGRFWFQTDYRPQRPTVGNLSTDLVNHFFRSVAAELKCNLHIRLLEPGENEHHRVEAMFKGFARALASAVQLGASTAIPSTKGVLS
jgi:imidazoleglycerol phosphate dehydratase HisB